jgi:hypothetical protein
MYKNQEASNAKTINLLNYHSQVHQSAGFMKVH